jgi:hypothetical protein
VKQPINPSARTPQTPAGNNPSLAAPRPAPQQNQYDPGSVRLRYTERSRILVHGPVTGRVYEFSSERPLAHVSVRDAQGLLNTRYFVRG